MLEALTKLAEILTAASNGIAIGAMILLAMMIVASTKITLSLINYVKAQAKFDKDVKDMVTELEYVVSESRRLRKDLSKAVEAVREQSEKCHAKNS